MTDVATKLRAPLFALIGIAALSTAGCASLSAGTSSATSSSASSHARAGALLEIHDPKKVTGIVPASCHAGPGPMPDPACAPGAVDPAVTQANISSTICHSGYTTTVRPSSSQTDKTKAQMYKSYGVPTGTVSELDHLVPLELGGANDTANLWPEVGKQPNPKDKVENDLKRAVCVGKVKLADAQEAIASDWLTAEQNLGLEN